jgi:hypothetical protein
MIAPDVGRIVARRISRVGALVLLTVPGEWLLALYQLHRFSQFSRSATLAPPPALLVEALP